jgi:hypothetical protein
MIGRPVFDPRTAGLAAVFLVIETPLEICYENCSVLLLKS